MKKFIKITGIVIVFILAIMVLLPYVFKGKLVQIAKEEINKNVNAQVDFTGAGLSLFKSFPDFSLDLEGLQVIGKDKFEGDTLVYMDALSIDIDLLSVFKGAPYEIKKIVLDKPNIQLITLLDGSVNYDISMPSEPETPVAEVDSTAKPFTISMKAILIRDGKLLYDDKSLAFKMLLDNVNGGLSGNFSADLAEIQTKLSANKLNLTYDGVDYLSNVKTEFSSLVIADMKTSTYTLKNTEALLNQLPISFEGSFVLGEVDYGMDFSFKSKDDNFKSLLSLIPAFYTNQFEQIKANGAFVLDGSVKGIYNETTMPGFNIDLRVENASISYPDLPKSIDDIYILLSIKNATGILDETNINLNRFQMKMAGNLMAASFKLKTPISNPDFDVAFKGKLDLGSLADVMPLEKEESVKGILDFNFGLKAKMSDIENKRYDQIAAKGSFKAQDVEYKSAMYNLPIVVKNTAMEFSPASIDLSALDMRLGKSDFSGSGKIGDFLPYYLSDGVLKGKLTVNSDLIDVNELMAGMIVDTVPVAQTDTSKMALNLPERIDFSFSALAKKMVYENYVLNQVNANIAYKDQVISLNPLKADLLGGSMKMDGMIDASNQENLPFNFDFAIKDFDIFKSYQTIGLFQKAVPIAENTTGEYSTGFDLKGKMDKEMNLDYESLLGGGTLQTTKIVIDSVKAMNQLASLLGNEKYSRLVTDGLNFSFEILNGKVYQKPIVIKYAGTDVSIGGNVGFDQKLDYNLVFQIPYDKLGSGVQSGISKLISAGANKGIPVDLGTSVTVKAKIDGLVSDPKVSLDYKDFMSDRKADLTAKENQELDKQKEELKQKTKAEAEKLLSEAKSQGDALIAEAEAGAARVHEEALKAAELAKSEANKQADRLIEEASKKGPLAVLAANEAAKKIRSEGEKNANKLVTEADKKAADMVSQARLQADELLRKAQEKADKL